MSGQKDFPNLAQFLEEIHAELRLRKDSVDQMVPKVKKAWEMYKKFRAHFSKVSFDVRKLQLQSNGKRVESGFDWQALDKVSSRT